MKKKKRVIIIVILALLLIGGLTGFFLLKDNESLNSYEKEWIASNSTKIQNISVVNDQNLFGKNGSGIFYDFLNDFGEKYNINLNIITYKNNENPSGAILGVANNLPDGAFSFYKDHYVYISKEQITYNYHDLENRHVGVLNANATYLNNYLNGLNLQVENYATSEELIKALKDGLVAGIIVPRMEYLDKILTENLSINFHFSDIAYHYYMNDINESRLKSIMNKYYNNWSKKSLKTATFSALQQEFLHDLKIAEKDLVAIQGNTLAYGLINNSPYEILAGGKTGGIVAEYIKQFSSFSGVEVGYKRYSNLRKFLRNINNNKIDLYLNYYTQNSNGTNIVTNIPIEIAYYTPKNSDIVINSRESLRGKTIYVLEESILANELSKVNYLNVKTYKNNNELKSILKKKDTILAIDSLVGETYERVELKKYHLEYLEETNLTYSFKSNKNEIFNTLLTKYINYLDNNYLKVHGLYTNETTKKSGSIISTISQYAMYLIVFIGIILILIYQNSKKVRLAKKIKKDDKLKYIDQLTSLKNRNYLNENISSWNKNTIYPQSVIMIDLDHLQEINDTRGYEEGDKQIQAGANILIRTQLDNSDIIRTDGNEFMVYLVGYTQKRVASYIHKLNKEFKKLPHEYGATLSYSMILDDLKNIEDAINECVEDIKKQKELKEEKNENN